MALTSSRMHAGKRRTLRATIVTIFSHETRDVSVFVKYDTIFRLFVWKYHNFIVLTFARYRGNILKVWWETLYGFVENLLRFPVVKQFWKFVKNWQSYHHEFGVLLLEGHSMWCVTCNIQSPNFIGKRISWFVPIDCWPASWARYALFASVRCSLSITWSYSKIDP